MNVLSSLWYDFVALLYPRICPGCEAAIQAGEGSVCGACLLEIRTTDHLENPQSNDLALRLRQVNLEAAVASLSFRKQGRSQDLVHALKYRNRQELGLWAARHWAGQLAESDWQPPWEVAVPIPLHPSKERKRGFNQSTLLAEGLAEVLGLQVAPKALQRLRHTETQTGKNHQERQANVANIFTLKQAEKISNRHVVLVDDVATTGATLLSGLKILQAAQPASLSVWTWAVAENQGNFF